ncbi:hypothetical protein Btru_059788 [Bulinus truncatus]|nr:hypothetical protein Btru_059788 [Bulinus truncatus]
MLSHNVGQVISGGLTFYSTPLYCTTIVSTYQTCPPTLCYASNTRTLCCMGLYKTTTGSLYQQCKCPSSVSCVPLSNTQTSIVTTPSYFYNTPLYCSSTPLPTICSNSDPCFNSTTRSSCCISVLRMPTTIGVTETMTVCSCNAGVQCSAPPVQ